MNTIDCTGCGGVGCTWYDAADTYGEHVTEEDACERCDGTGIERCVWGDGKPAVAIDGEPICAERLARALAEDPAGDEEAA